MTLAGLPWVGSKQRLSTTIAPLVIKLCKLSSHADYIEPFTGSASVFLHARELGLESKVILRDANQSLINFYVRLRDDKEFPRVCSNLTLSNDDIWDRYRSDGPPYTPEVFFLLLIYSYGNMWRENRLGQLNTPRNKKLPPNYAKMWFHRLMGLRRYLSGVEIHNERWKDKEENRNSVIYCDPPYTESTHDYVRGHWTLDHNAKLLTWMRNSRHPIILSMGHVEEGVKVVYESQINNQLSGPKGNDNPKRREVVMINDVAARLLEEDDARES